MRKEGHVTIGIDFPVRTKSEKVNGARMKKFADRVAAAFNKLRVMGANQIQMQHVHDVGYMILGYIPSEKRSHDRHGPTAAVEVDVYEQTAHVLLMKTYEACTPGMAHEDIKARVHPIIRDMLNNVPHDVVHGCLAALTKLIEQHEGVHTTLRISKAAHEVLKEHITTSMN